MADIREHHERAAHHNKQAADQRRESVKHNKAGDQKPPDHSKIVHGHHLHATEDLAHASEKHVEEHAEIGDPTDRSIQ